MGERIMRAVPGLDTTAECHIDARSVKCTANNPIPKPMGLNQRATAGGDSDCQQMLYRVAPDTGRDAVNGPGLSAVGTRVSLWGRVTGVNSGSHSFWMDDGSMLKSTVSNNERTGIRVIYDDTSATLPTVNAYVPFTPGVNPTIYNATGVLGAEMDDNDCPVPVLRVPKAAPTSDDVICVNQSTGDDDNSGIGWSNAVASLQVGIDKALAANPKKEVWVAAETYYGNFTIDQSIALYGGFAGGEENREERDWATHETILDGYPGTVICIDGTSGAVVRIDGFTVTNGDGGYGGGIYCSGGRLLLANNTFLSNVAGVGGGAVGCEGCTAAIWNNVFGTPDSPNVAPGAFAIYLGGCNSDSLIAGNTVCGNQRLGFGSGSFETSAAIACSQTAATIAGNLITGNGGSGITAWWGGTSILNNTIAGNTGCGVYVFDSGTAPPIVANNVIRDNAAEGVIVMGDGMQVVNNTIVRNRTGIRISGDGWSALVANNIIAYNHYGVNKTTYYTLVLDHNCLYNPHGTDYVGVSPGSTDILADPEFISLTGNDFRVEPYSPCIDAGNSDRVGAGWLSFDGRDRVQGTQVDIGAYETSPSAPPYVVWFLPVTSHEISAASTVNLSAVVSASGATTHLPGRPVTFDIVSGPGVLTTTLTETSSSGSHTADTVLSASAYGRVEVKAWTPDGAGGTSESRLVFWFYDAARTPVDLFLCVDCTFSMELTGHSAEASIQALLDYLVSHGVRLRAGGVKFDLGVDMDGQIATDYIEEDEKRPFDWFDDLDGFTYWWLADGYSANGGDWPELQLDALDYAAQEMNAHATDSRKFIVLVTDDVYHYLGDGYLASTETKQGVTDALTASGCSVFISLWDTYDSTHTYLQSYWYSGLAVNNGGFDAADYETTTNIKYPFVGLKASILGS